MTLLQQKKKQAIPKSLPKIGSRTTGGASLDQRSVTAALDSLASIDSIPNILPEAQADVAKVRQIIESVAKGTTVPGFPNKLTVKNFITSLVIAGFNRNKEGDKSLYRSDGKTTGRISDHFTKAKFWANDTGDKFSIVIQRPFNFSRFEADAVVIRSIL